MFLQGKKSIYFIFLWVQIEITILQVLIGNCFKDAFKSLEDVSIKRWQQRIMNGVAEGSKWEKLESFLEFIEVMEKKYHSSVSTQILFSKLLRAKHYVTSTRWSVVYVPDFFSPLHSISLWWSRPSRILRFLILLRWAHIWFLLPQTMVLLSKQCSWPPLLMSWG